MANFIKFIGTAGARFVTISQMRSSGGVWVSYEGANLLIDPGPGSLVRCLESKPCLDPAVLDGVVFTHKHIDHSNDANIIIEAMTEGGFKKRGVVFAPSDMIDGDSPLTSYAKKLPEKIVTLREGSEYSLRDIKFSTPLRHIHSVETYGLKFHFGAVTVSLVADTKFSEKIAEAYKADTVIINTVFIDPLEHIDHLSLKEAGVIIRQIRPRKAVLTHFGRDILKNGPERFAAQLTDQCGLEVVAATDGMTLTI